MIAIDTNVLVAAHRSDAGRHQQALAWVRFLAEGREPWAIPVLCLGEFVRVVTHRRVFDPPSTIPHGHAPDGVRGLRARRRLHYIPGMDTLEIISDEEFKENLSKAKGYVGVILFEGPNYNSPEARTIIYQHGRRNMSLRKAGKFPVICPVVDGGRIKGFGVFCVSEEEVKEIMDGDPGVQAGVFTYELHAVRGFPGASLP